MTVSQRNRPRHTVRPFEPGDGEGFRSLYETVFGRERSARWFEWKYERTPYADHVPIVVGERDGEIVGCRSFFALEVRVDGEVTSAFQPCDTMVHPDHRKQGLCSRMNVRALERYADGGPSLCFNFPNEASKPVNRKHGWQPIGTVPMYYRLQNPVGALARILGDDGRDFPRAGAVRRTLERTAAGPIAGADRLRDSLAARTSGVSVERHETVPAEALESIYRRAIPDQVHVDRTATYYRWRLANPAQRYVTYVATREGTPVAAVVVSPQDDRLRIVDTLPRELETEAAAIERSLLAAIDDYRDRPLVTAFGRTLPAPIRTLFVPDTRLPLGRAQPSARTLFVRDLDDDLSVERGSSADWSLSRLDLDTT